MEIVIFIITWKPTENPSVTNSFSQQVKPRNIVLGTCVPTSPGFRHIYIYISPREDFSWYVGRTLITREFLNRGNEEILIVGGLLYVVFTILSSLINLSYIYIYIWTFKVKSPCTVIVWVFSGNFCVCWSAVIGGLMSCACNAHNLTVQLF